MHALLKVIKQILISRIPNFYLALDFAYEKDGTNAFIK